MTATNHALTGALLGFTISNPAIAIPVAFISHFALDAIPHYDPPGDELTRIGSKRFRNELVLHAVLCVLLVVSLALTHPRHWLTAAVCAFAAASPDLFWIPKYMTVTSKNKLPPNSNLFWRFHHAIQWWTGPQLLGLELVWFAASVWLLARFIA
jgi:hypothetical protein